VRCLQLSGPNVVAVGEDFRPGRSPARVRDSVSGYKQDGWLPQENFKNILENLNRHADMYDKQIRRSSKV
jgi:hypothetical protein